MQSRAVRPFIWLLASCLLFAASGATLRANCYSNAEGCFQQSFYCPVDPPGLPGIDCRVPWDSAQWHECCNWGYGSGCCSNYWKMRQCGDLYSPHPPPYCDDGWYETAVIEYADMFCSYDPDPLDPNCRMFE